MSPTPFNLPLNAKIVAKHGTTSVYSLKDGRLAFVDYEKQRMFLDGSRNFGSGVYGSGHNSSWADERLASVARKGGSDVLIRVKAVKPKQSAMPPSEFGYDEEQIPDTDFTRAMRFIPQAFLNWAKTYKPGDPLPVIPPGYGDKELCDRSVSNDSYSQSGVTVDDVVRDTLSAMGFPDINPDLALSPEPKTKSMPKFEQKGILGREIRDMARNIADSILSARGLWRDELNKIRCGSGPNANRFTDIFGTGCDVPGADMAGNIVGMIRSGDEIPGPVDDVAGKLEGARERISDATDGTEIPGERGSMRDFLSAKLTGVRGGHTPHIEGDSPMTDHDPAAAMTATTTPARPSERWKFMGLRTLVSRNKARERKKKTEDAAKKAKREYSEFLSSDEYRRWEADFVRTEGRLPNAGEKVHQYALHLGYESPVEGGTFMGLADVSSTDTSKTHHEAMVDEILNDSRLWPFGIGYESDRKIAAKRKEIEDSLEEYYLMTLHSAYNAGGPKQIEVVRPDGTREMVDNPEHKERFVSAVPGYFRVKHPDDPMSRNNLADAIAVTSVNSFWSPGDPDSNLVGFVGSEGALFDPITGLPVPGGSQVPGSGRLTPGPLSSVNRGSAPLWARGTNNPFQFTITLDPMWFGSRDYQTQKIKGFGTNHLGMELSRESFLMHTADHELNHVDDFSWRLGQKLGFESQSEWMDRLKGQTFNPATGTWADVIDLRRDAKPNTFLRQQIDELDSVLRNPLSSDWEKMDALWQFYLKNINFDSGVESRYARWLSGDYQKVPGGARLSKEAIARRLQEIRDNLSARGYGEETGVPQMNFWRDMVDTLTGTWDPATRTFDGIQPQNIMNLLRGDSRLDPRGAPPLGQARLDNAVSNLLAGFIGGTYSGESDWEFAAELRTHLNKPGALQDIREFLADSDRNIHNLDESSFMTLVAKYVGEEDVYRLYGETPPPNRFAPIHGGGGGGGGGTPPGGGGGGAIRPAIPLGPGPTRTPPTPSGGGGGTTPPGGRAPSPRRPTLVVPPTPSVPRADEPPNPDDDILLSDDIDLVRNAVDYADSDWTRAWQDLQRASKQARITLPGTEERRRIDKRVAELVELEKQKSERLRRLRRRLDELEKRPRESGNLRGRGVRPVTDIGRPGTEVSEPEPGIPGTGVDEPDVGTGRLRGPGVRRPARPTRDEELVEPTVRGETEADRISPERRRADAERERRVREIFGDDEKTPTESARPDTGTTDSSGAGSSDRRRPTASDARDELNAARERARDRRWAEREEAEKRSEDASRRMAEAREEGDTGSSSMERDTLELAAEQRKQNILALRRETDYTKRRMAQSIDDQIAARRMAIERAQTATDPKERRGQQILATAHEIKLMYDNGDLDYQSQKLQLDALSDLADLNGTPLYYGDDGVYRLESSVTEWQRTERVGEIDQSPDAIAARRAIADRIFGESDSSDLLGPATSQPTNSRPRTMKMFNQTTGEIVYVDASANDVIQRLRGEGFAPDARRGAGSAPSAPTQATRRPSRQRSGGRRIRMVDDSGNEIFISADDGDGYYDATRDGFREARGPESGMGSGRRRNSTDPRFATDPEDDRLLARPRMAGTADRENDLSDGQGPSAGMRSGEREDREFRRQRQVDDLADYLAEGDGAFMTPEQAYLQRDGAIVRRETARDRMERLIRERDGVENGVIGADLTDEQAERRVARLNEQIDDLAGEIAEMDKTAELYDSHARNLESRTPTNRLRDSIDTSLGRGFSSGGWRDDSEAGMSRGRNIRGPRSAFGDDEPSAGMSGGGTNRPMVSADREGRPLTSVASPSRNGTVDENHEANLRAAEDDIELVRSEIGALEAALAEAKTTGEWRGADFGVHFGDKEPDSAPQRAYLTRANGGVGAPVNLNAEETKQKDAISKAERRLDSAKKELVRLQRVAVDKRTRRDQNVLDLEDIPEGELEQLVAEAESVKQAVKLRGEERQKLMQDSRFSDLDWEQRVAAVDDELERMGMLDPLSPGRGETAAIHVGADTLEGGVLDPSYTAGDESMMTGGGNTGMLNQSQIRNVRQQRDQLAETLKTAERLVEQLETGTTNITPSNKAEADLLNGLTNSNKFSAGEALDLSKANSRVDAATLSQRIRELLAAKMERDRVSLAQQDRILKRVDESPRFGYVSAYPLRAEGTVTEGYFGRNSGKKVPANIGTFLTEVEGRSSGRATPDGFVNVKDRPMLDRWKNTLRGTQWLAIGGDDTIVRGFGNSPGDEAQIMGINTPVFGFSFGVSEAANYRTLLGDIGMALAARAVELRRRGEEVTPESVMKARKQVENSRILMLARNGSTIEEIAEKTGRSRQFVSELLRLAGITNPYTEGY